jgi:predicted ATPase
MMTRLYANNFRCLVAFEVTFDPFGVLCGPNGAGKSSVFDVIGMLRNLATGETLLGSEGERDIPALEFTGWLDSTTQEFEIDIEVDGHALGYLIHLEQVSSELKPRVLRERATCDKRLLFERDLEGVKFQKAGGPPSGFPLDWRQAALGSIQPAVDRRGNSEGILGTVY